MSFAVWSSLSNNDYLFLLDSQTLQGEVAERFEISIPKIPAYLTVENIHDKVCSSQSECDIMMSE